MKTSRTREKNASSTLNPPQRFPPGVQPFAQEQETMILSMAIDSPTARYLPSESSESSSRPDRDEPGRTERRTVPSSETIKAEQVEDEKTKVFLRALQRTGRRQLWGVRLRLTRHALHLEGDVTCFFLKQLAQEAVRPHTRGLRICNELRVAQL